MDNADTWLHTNTFHHRQFSDLSDLVRRKEAQGLSISLCIPTLNEARTIGALIDRLRLVLCQQFPLLDEIVVIDSGSSDRTVALAQAAGADACHAADILPHCGPCRGKGENLWKALYQLKGDILVYLDGDITNMHPRFVTGLVGPLLHRPDIGYVKSFYARPSLHQGEAVPHGGGRVTEILIRPLFSLFFPQLTAFVQPLSGEYAARRSLLETLSFPVGYGVEAAHLVDIAAGHGMAVLGQTDLDERRHRSRSNTELGRMAFAILQVLGRRLQPPGCGKGIDGLPHDLLQFQLQQGGFQQTVCRIDEIERPPMLEQAAYRRKRGLPSAGFDPARGMQLVCEER